MPSPSKLHAAACLISCCAAVAACQRSDQPNNNASAQNVVTPAANIAATVPLPQPPMNRAALLGAVAKARSAAAAGVDEGQAQQLDGKEFELRIRFGCGGVSAEAKAHPLGWSLDQKRGVLRVHATPNLSKDDPSIAAMGLRDIEAVEGFWLQRPWLLDATCPAKPPPPSVAPSQAAAAPAAEIAKAPAVPPALPLAPKVGIAQFFTATDPRTARRDDRPYQAVKKLDVANIGQQGFDLVLSGRLRALDGRVIRCVASNPDAPPTCVVSASFDHVWIEDAASKERIADWSSS